MGEAVSPVFFKEILCLSSSRRQPDIDDLECLLWYGDVGVPTRADVVEAQRTGGIGFGFANPFLVSCRVDSSLRGDGAAPPEAVSLAAKMRTVDPKCKRIVTNCLRLVHKGWGERRRRIRF